MLRSEQRIQHNKSNYFSMGAGDELFAPMAIPFVQCGQDTPLLPLLCQKCQCFLHSSVTLKTWNNQNRGNPGRVSLKQNFNLIQKLL